MVGVVGVEVMTTCWGPGAAGVCGPAAGSLSLHPLPTPASTNKLPGGGSISINAGKPGGGTSGGYLSGGTLATEELAVVIVVEAMVA